VRRSTKAPLSVAIGTSGWQYRDWRGAFYPSELPSRRWLGHYADHFETVEIDSTFYRLPERQVFEKWSSETPDDIRFFVKASRFLTHLKRLREPEPAVQRLLDSAGGLGSKLAGVLVQLPPTLRASTELLQRTLTAFDSVPVAVEFRHDSWWHSDIADLLSSFNAATVWADRRSRRTPQWVTSDWGYVRLHEGTASPLPTYGRKALLSWAERITDQAARWQRCFVYFNNDPGGAAVRNASFLKTHLERLITT
jgi:uncharacterized protein YecE (DUF72 family)